MDRRQIAPFTLTFLLRSTVVSVTFSINSYYCLTSLLD